MMILEMLVCGGLYININNINTMRDFDRMKDVQVFKWVCDTVPTFKNNPMAMDNRDQCMITMENGYHYLLPSTCNNIEMNIDRVQAKYGRVTTWPYK